MSSQMANDEKSILLGLEEGRPYPPRKHKSSECRPARVMVVAALFLLGFHAFGYTAHWPSFPSDLLKKKPTVCSTPACIHASSEILYNLSPNFEKLDPCTDFEELVCGGWRDRHDLRPDQGDAFTGTQMSEASQLLLRHILEAQYPGKSDHSAFSPMRLLAKDRSADEENFDKMKSAYDACTDEEQIKKLGLQPLTDLIEKLKSSFPGANGSDVQSDEGVLDRTISFLAQRGISGLVALGTGADDKDPDTVVVSVGAPYTIGLPSKEYYDDQNVVHKYTDVVAQVLSSVLSADDSSPFRAVVDLEKRLADASPSTQEREDVTFTYNPMSLDDAAALAPQVGLQALVKDLKPENVKVERLIVMAPEYMKQLGAILASTEKDVIENYFIWKVVQAMSSYLDSDAIKPYSRFRNELQGRDPDSKPERWRTCVGHVDDGLGWILSRFFVEKAFSAKAKKFGDTIVTDIKEQFIETLKSTKWMENEVIELAIAKVHNIVQKIGYPTKSPDIMNPDKLHSFYDQLVVDASAFFKNAVEMNKWAVAEEWSALGKPVDRDQWDMTVPTVNAYYNPPGNEIVFPAGIMQFPVFDVNVPEYMSYGAFGSVAGHELSHAFDSTGRHYDQNGNYTDWWTNKTIAAFQDRADCFVKQYANYTVEGPDGKPLHVNGRLTLGENIADAGGLSAAFAAWQKRASKKPNQDLPGLSKHFTQEQLFFVSYSNWWCGKTRKEAAVDRIYRDPHAPKWARILGTMANSKDFKKSFKCESREPVCKLW